MNTTESILALLGMGVLVHAIFSFFQRGRKPEGPYNTPWNPLEAVTITVAAYLLSQVLVGLTFVTLGINETNFDTNSVSANFVTTALFEIYTVLLLTFFIHRRNGNLRSIGVIKPRWRDLGYALSGYGVYFVSYIVLFAVAQAVLPQINFNQQQELGFDTTTTGLALIAVFISLVVLPPVVEEFVCRGFLYSGLRSRLGKITAALITSFIFAIAHLQFGSGSALLWVAAMDTFVLSLVLVYLRDKTGGLTAPIIVHATKNGIAFMALFIFHIA